METGVIYYLVVHLMLTEARTGQTRLRKKGYSYIGTTSAEQGKISLVKRAYTIKGKLTMIMSGY